MGPQNGVQIPQGRGGSWGPGRGQSELSPELVTLISLSVFIVKYWSHLPAACLTGLLKMSEMIYQALDSLEKFSFLNGEKYKNRIIK